jgi:putative endonuclease
MYYVYILRSEKDKKLYIGFTANLRDRIKNHNLGLNSSTKNRRPLKIIYYEAFENEHDAREKEIFYKSGRGHEVIYKMLKDYFVSVGRPSDSEGS